jgi:transketolase C-terminal domain/subunit
MRKKFVELAKQTVANDTRSYVLLGDISVGAFLDSQDQLIPQVFNMGIAEQAMIGFAAGLTETGGHVIVHTIAAFLVERAFEQIKLCCGYNQRRLILVSANGPFDYDRLGPTHHCASDVSLLSTVPNLDICLPSTVQDLEQAWQQALHSERSTYIRLTNRVARLEVEPTVLPGGWRQIYFTDGQASVTDNGSNTALICTGESLKYCLSRTTHNASIYWNINPAAKLPADLQRYKSIKVFEPYTVPQFMIPDDLPHHNIQRKLFSIEPKKIMVPDMGWEDFV